MFKIPKTPGACVDRLHAIDGEKAKLNQQIAKFKEEEAAIEEHLIQTCDKNDSNGILGRKAKGVIKRKDLATVKDWSKFYAWILKKKDFAVLNKAVNQAAVRERWEAGEALPGVGKFTRIDVSVTKL